MPWSMIVCGYFHRHTQYPGCILTTYSEFTVDYENQTNEFTSINICEQAYIDNPEILFSVDKGTDPEESKKCWDELFKDVVITCTVTYTDGTTEEKKL